MVAALEGIANRLKHFLGNIYSVWIGCKTGVQSLERNAITF